jgi:hypothetical protein
MGAKHARLVYGSTTEAARAMTSDEEPISDSAPLPLMEGGHHAVIADDSIRRLFPKYPDEMRSVIHQQQFPDKPVEFGGFHKYAFKERERFSFVYVTGMKQQCQEIVAEAPAQGGAHCQQKCRYTLERRDD